MSLFDSASLVVTPNGTKASKLYAIKPTDASGDLVVTRATTATRVNSAGLVELVPVNLLTYSQEFDNAAWSKYQATITANSITAPNGTLTADSLISSTTGTAVLYRSSVTSGVCTISVYAKEGTNNILDIGFTDGSDYIVKVNLTTGTITSATSGVTGTITSVGSGWYRVTATRTMSAIGNIFINNPTTISGKIIYIWGAQLVTGTSAKEYFPTTDRLNVPRLDYTNSTCPSILVEPQRTNILTYSEGNLSTYDVSDNCTNAGVSINGFSNSIQVPSTGLTYFYKTATTISSQVYTLSCFIKMDDNSVPVLGANSSLGNLSFVAKGNIANDNLKVTLIGNNIYRISATTIGNGVAGSFGIVRYSTQTLKSFKISAIQLEAGSYATSYIPTVASSVTRNADVISKTGISSLIGQTEGTIFIDFNFKQGIESFILGAGNGSYYNNLAIECYSNKAYLTIFNNSSSLQGTIETSTLTTGKHKLAVAYNSTQVTMYLDGVLVNSLGAITFPSFNNFYLGNLGSDTNPKNININSSSIWKSRLSNTELATLTTI